MNNAVGTVTPLESETVQAGDGIGQRAQSAMSLDHPTIVAVYDIGEDTLGQIPVPYVVMEYVDGRTLQYLLRDGRQLVPERGAEIAAGVLRALRYSHRHGILHGDLQPRNVLVTRAGEVKVNGFRTGKTISEPRRPRQSGRGARRR